MVIFGKIRDSFSNVDHHVDPEINVAVCTFTLQKICVILTNALIISINIEDFRLIVVKAQLGIFLYVGISASMTSTTTMMRRHKTFE